MIRLGRFQVSIEGLALGCLALALVLSIQRCTGIAEGKRVERLAQLEANAYKASLSSTRSRAVTDSVTRVVDAVTRRVANQVAVNRKLSARLDATLAANDSLLGADSADVPTLRLALARTTEVARLYRDSTDVLLGGIDRLLAAHEVERQAWMAERESAARELTAERQVSEHLRKRARCRVLGMPCLTRVQSGMVGAGGVLLLLLLP